MGIEALLTPEQRMIRDLAREFATKEVMPRAFEIDRTDEFPRDLYRRMGAIGLLGLILPQEVGGGGADTVCQAIVPEARARPSPAVANAQVMAIEEGLTISQHAPAAIRDQYMPGIISGDIIPAFALTEPDAGSDAAGIKTTATKDGDSYSITGTKTFITCGPIADIVIVIAVTDPA